MLIGKAYLKARYSEGYKDDDIAGRRFDQIREFGASIVAAAHFLLAPQQDQ